MQLLIIRHADPDYSRDHLTEAGHLEAKALGKSLKSAGIDELYASPLGRAQATAKYIAEETDLSIQTENWTRELEGFGTHLPNGDRIAAWDYPGELIVDRKVDFTSWDRDSDYWLKDPDYLKMYEELISSSDQFLKEQGLVRQGGIYKITDPSVEKRKIALVCHGGFGMTWLAHLLYFPLSFVWQAFWIPASSVTTILFEKRSEDVLVPRCLRLSDVSHLEKAGLPVQKSGLWALNYDPS